MTTNETTPHPETPAALLVDCFEGGPLADGIYLFSSEQEAAEFGLTAAVADETIDAEKTEDGQWVIFGDSFSDPIEALRRYSDELSTLDFYHLRDVVVPPFSLRLHDAAKMSAAG